MHRISAEQNYAIPRKPATAIRDDQSGGGLGLIRTADAFRRVLKGEAIAIAFEFQDRPSVRRVGNEELGH